MFGHEGAHGDGARDGLRQKVYVSVSQHAAAVYTAAAAVVDDPSVEGDFRIFARPSISLSRAA